MDDVNAGDNGKSMSRKLKPSVGGKKTNASVSRMQSLPSLNTDAKDYENDETESLDRLEKVDSDVENNSEDENPYGAQQNAYNAKIYKYNDIGERIENDDADGEGLSNLSGAEAIVNAEAEMKLKSGDKTALENEQPKWATQHPLAEAIQIEHALQVMLDDIRGRMGQDVDYESLPLREYFRRGFACSHRACQTDASDIIDLGALMLLAKQLRIDLTDIRHELELQIALIHTDMEHRMKEMFALMFREATKQDKLGDQKRRRELERMRRGMRQQLKNAVEGVKKWYIDYYEEILKKERALRVNNTVGRERFDDLQRLVATADENAKKMRSKIDELQRELAAAVAAASAQRASPKTVETTTTNLASSPPTTGTRSAGSYERIAKEKSLKDGELNDARSEMEKYQAQNAKLLQERETSRQESASKSEHLQLLQQQIDNMGASVEEQAARADAQLRSEKQKQLAAMENLQRQAREEQLRLMRQAQHDRSAAELITQAANVRYTDWLENYVVEVDGRQVPLRDVTDELKRRYRIEQELREEVALLTGEAMRQNKIWGKKFTILQSSQAALRNEMYLRRMIERKMEPYLQQDNWQCTPREQQVHMVDSFASGDGVEQQQHKMLVTRNVQPFLALGPVPPATVKNKFNARHRQQKSVLVDAHTATTESLIYTADGNAKEAQQKLPANLALPSTAAAVFVGCATQTDDVVIVDNDVTENFSVADSSRRDEDNNNESENVQIFS